MIQRLLNNALIVGGTGMLGRVVTELLSLEKDTRVHVISRNPPRTQNQTLENKPLVAHHAVDVTNTQLFADCLREVQPTQVIYCAACTDVDKCEIESYLAFDLHCNGLETVYRYAPEAKLVYISTDAVFDGTTGNYREFSKPNPINQYALSKRAGEMKALELFANSIVIRTSIFGFHTYPATSLAEWALDNLKLNKPIAGFQDVYFNPVYTIQLARIIIGFIYMNFKGLIHVSSDTSLSKYEFLVRLASIFGYDTKLIEKKSVDSVIFKAERPRNITLINTSLKRLIGYVPKLADGLAQFYSDYTRFNHERISL